jgi:hypothetical protein
MPIPSQKPYWVDELRRKHEGYPYEDTSSRTLKVEHEGRSLQLLMPEYMPPTTVKVAASTGDLLFLMGEQLDEEEDGEIIEGGDGIVMIARRHVDRDDTYWLCVWHNLFPQTLRRLGSEET